jgi:uncharacterized lipoprotein YehR (DUF1307 family)
MAAFIRGTQGYMKFSILIFCISICGLNLPQAVAWTVNSEQIFDHLESALPQLNKIAGLKSEDQLSLVEKFKHRTFTLKTKEDTRKELDDVLLEMRNLLGGSDLQNYKNSINENQIKIRRLQSQITEYNLKRLNAPQTKGTFDLLTKSKEDYNNLIIQGTSEINATKADVQTAKRQAGMVLSRQGLNFTEQQLDSLLFTCTSDSEVELIGAFQAVMVVSQKLKMEAARGTMNRDLQNQLLGLHCLLLRSLIALQIDYKNKIDTVYLVKLAKIRLEANTQLASIANQLPLAKTKEETGSYTISKTNYETIVKVADLYETFLNTNRKKLDKSLEDLIPRYNAAETLYLSNELAGQLVSMINEADVTASVLTLQVPELDTQISRDPDLMAKFVELNGKLSTN